MAFMIIDDASEHRLIPSVMAASALLTKDNTGTRHPSSSSIFSSHRRLAGLTRLRGAENSMRGWSSLMTGTSFTNSLICRSPMRKQDSNRRGPASDIFARSLPTPSADIFRFNAAISIRRESRLPISIPSVPRNHSDACGNTEAKLLMSILYSRGESTCSGAHCAKTPCEESRCLHNS